jgi:hypothetical protein
MGFFDFLQAQGNGAFQSLGTAGRTSTRIVHALLDVPKPERNQAWSEQFLAHVGNAAFFARDPCIIQGADMPHFVLHSTPGALAFPTLVLHHMMDDFLLEQGLGVVINPHGQDSDWAFTFGDLLNFHLHGWFYPAEAGEQAPVKPLSAQARLPEPARNALRAFLERLGVAAPRVMFAACDHAGPGSLELVFGFSPQEFKSMDDFRFAMNRIAWFLPRNYSYSVAGNQARRDGAFELL